MINLAQTVNIQGIELFIRIIKIFILGFNFRETK